MIVGIRDRHVVFALRFRQKPVSAGTGELVRFQCVCLFKKTFRSKYDKCVLSVPLLRSLSLGWGVSLYQGVFLSRPPFI